MTSKPSLPSLRLIPGRQRTRSDAESVEAIAERGRVEKKAVRDAIKAEATRIAEEAARIEAEIEAAALQLYQQHISSHPFRFLDLPTEVQDMVYSAYSVNVESSYKQPSFNPLSTFVVPALAQVNQEIRADFLGVFLKQTRFHIWIGPYTHSPKHWRLPLNFDNDRLYRTIKAAKDPLDPIFLSPHVSALVNPAMVFQNVTFLLHELQSPQDLHKALCKERFYNQATLLKGSRFAALSLQWFNRKLGFRKLKPHLVMAQGVEKAEVMLRTIGFAEEVVAAREPFNGFTLDDLRRIAIKMVTGFGEIKSAKVEVPGPSGSRYHEERGRPRPGLRILLGGTKRRQ